MDFIPLSSEHINIPAQRFPSRRKRNLTKMSSNAINNVPDNGKVDQKFNKKSAYDSKLKSRIKTKAKGKVSYLSFLS